MSTRFQSVSLPGWAIQEMTLAHQHTTRGLGMYSIFLPCPDTTLPKRAEDGYSPLTFYITGIPDFVKVVSVWINEMDSLQEPQFGTAVFDTTSVQLNQNVANGAVRQVRVIGNTSWEWPLSVGLNLMLGW